LAILIFHVQLPFKYWTDSAGYETSLEDSYFVYVCVI